MLEAQNALLEDDEQVTRSCFVICPIGDKDAEMSSPERETWEASVEVYEEVIQPACRAFGLTPIRADQIARTGEIPEQVCKHLRDADIVIADLTAGNPNVMYELGLRHTTGKLTIQLGEKNRLPFDVAAIRTIMFRRTQGGLIQARKQLSESLSTGITSGGDHVTATRVWLQGSAWNADMRLDDRLADEPGFLEKLADLDEHVVHLPALTTEVGNVMNEMHTITEGTVKKIDKVNKSGAPASARLHLANKLAADLEPHAKRLADIAVSYELAVQKVDPGVRYMLSLPKGESNEPEKDALRTNVQSAIDSVEQYINSMSGLRDQLEIAGEATRSLRRVNGQARAALARLINASQQLLRWRSLL